MGDPPLEEQGESPHRVALKASIFYVVFLLWSSGFSHVGVAGQNHTFTECFDMAVEQIADARCPETSPERKECLSYLLSTSILPCFKHAGNSEAIHVLVSDVGSDLVAGLLQRAVDFSAITGHEVIVHGVSEEEMLQQMDDQLSSEDLFYSGWILPHIFVPKLSEQGALLDVTTNVTENQGLDWEDVVQYFQDYGAKYLDKIMAIPMDGNMMILYYRKDLFVSNNLKLPTTWEQVLEMAERFNGTDMNDDGVKDFGICLDRRAGVEEFWIKSLMAPYLQSEGTGQGMLLDPNGLRPLVNNIAMAWVLELYTQLLKFSPPSSRDGDFDLNYEYFTSGRCLMTLHSGKIFKKSCGTEFAKNIGLGVLPGSWYVYDRSIKDVSRCTERLCPHGRKDTDGNIVNYAPYSAMGGLVGAVNRLSSKNSREVMLAFLSFVASRAVSFEMVVTTDTLDPYRWSQLHVERWSQRGWDYDCSLQYINVISRMFVSKNVVSEPALPHSLGIGKILEDGVESFMKAPAAAAEESMAEMESLINSAITQFGREDILQAYRRSLHLPYNPVERKSSSSRYSLRVTVMGVVILLAILMLVAMWFLYMSTLRKFSRHGHGNVAAPGAGLETSLVVTDIQDSTAFWETLDADVMDRALHLHNECIRRVLRDNKGYESATEGDSFIMAFHSARDAITFCIEAQLELLKVDWPEEIIESEFSRTVRRDSSKATLQDICEAVAEGDTYENKAKAAEEQTGPATKPPLLMNVDTPVDEVPGLVWVGNPAFDESLASDPLSATGSTTPPSSIDAESTYEEDDDGRRLSEIVTTVPGIASGGDDFWGLQTPQYSEFQIPARPVGGGIPETAGGDGSKSLGLMQEGQKDPSLALQSSKFLTMPRFGKTKETQRTEDNSYLYRQIDVWLNRGLRVRIGVHTGVENADDIEVNDASGRTMYTGQSMSMAKAVSDTAHGGQVVVSESTYKALPLEQLTQVNVLHCGEHLVANDLPSLQLYEFISSQLIERVLHTPPVRTLDCLAKGWSDAPTGEVSLAFTFVVGAEVLSQWNKKIFKLSLQIFEDVGKGLLDEFSGYQVEVADGLFLTSFPDAISAIAWSVKLHEEVSLAKWPTPLLNHELCEEFTVTEMTAGGDLLMRTTRGLRLKTGIARGDAKACPHATTGQMAYRGRVINRAARLAKFAIAGQVLCSSTGVNEPIEIFNMFMEHAKNDDNPYAQRSKRQNFLDTKHLFNGDVVEGSGSSEADSSDDSDVF
ncbi:hypothetical protein BSKO_06846 [Bryopsis sp. KO-2023]|nr:hypothetical protein BSKO_06846 [Bryopsis sp. KO-2023]